MSCQLQPLAAYQNRPCATHSLSGQGMPVSKTDKAIRQIFGYDSCIAHQITRILFVVVSIGSSTEHSSA